jgi:carboxyl-terminal processing protease
VADLKAKGMERLILDLRNNGGGLLDQAIEVAEQFLPRGASVVETRGRTRDSFQSYRASGRRPPLDLPVVVLVNRGTASAAEIVSGAIQDHDVGLVVGTPTWGKGLVQTVYSLSYGAGLALTTAKYYTPSGRLIQRDYTSFYDYYNYDPETEDPPPPEEGAALPAPDQAPAQAETEAFRTDLGREVYGGGGITPDRVVEIEDATPFDQFLLSRSAYFNFAVDYHNRQPVTGRDWTPPADLLDRFKAWLIAEKLGTPEEIAEGLATAAEQEFSRRQIEAEIMNAAFGQEARHRVIAAADPQIQEALSLFPRAAELRAQRRELEEGPRRTAVPDLSPTQGG